MRDLVRRARELGGFSLEAELCSLMADEIERLRKEKQELELQYLSDQGQWIEETGRLREALRHYVSECDCNGGTYHQEDHITGKTLIKDCPKCEPARTALGDGEND